MRRVVSKYSTGQFEPAPDLGQINGITEDEIAWSREQGAVDDEDILDLISKHKAEVGR